MEYVLRIQLFLTRDPDLSVLDSGSRVLVQHTDDLWTNATVQDILEDRSAFCVKMDHSKAVAEVKPNQIIPLHHEEEDTEVRSLYEKQTDIDAV